MILTNDYRVVKANYPEEEEQEEEGYYLWIYYGGSLEVEGPFDNDYGDHVIHSDMWGYNLIETVYRGDYQIDSGVVSITPPYRWEHRNIPKSLVTKLESRFPGVRSIK